jgi:flagellar FliL protein
MPTMSDSPSPEASAEEPLKKKSKKPMIIGLFLMLVLGGGGFYATFSGMILGPAAHHGNAAAEVTDLPDIAFVPVDPLTVALGAVDSGRHLRFVAQIEVNSSFKADVALLLPRISDVMNGYLRAVDPDILQDPTAFQRIRSHLLRRVQLVSGEGRVRDLLITEFVMN